MKLAAFYYWLGKQIEEAPEIEQYELDYIDVGQHAWYSNLLLTILERPDGTKTVSVDGV